VICFKTDNVFCFEKCFFSCRHGQVCGCRRRRRRRRRRCKPTNHPKRNGETHIFTAHSMSLLPNLRGRFAHALLIASRASATRSSSSVPSIAPALFSRARFFSTAESTKTEAEADASAKVHHPLLISANAHLRPDCCREQDRSRQLRYGTGGRVSQSLVIIHHRAVYICNILLSKLEAELKDQKQRVLRAWAEVENMRVRYTRAHTNAIAKCLFLEQTFGFDLMRGC